MKKLLMPILAVILGSFSCNNPTSKGTESSNLQDTTGFFAARNMKGLAFFKIGESTYSEIIDSIKENIRKDYKNKKETELGLTRYSEYQERYLDFKFDKKGNIASQFNREDFGSIYTEVKYDTINSYLKEDFLEREIFGCPNIREIRMHSFYIGDIEISDLKLKFYKDTLYQIYCSQNDEVEEGFKVKYGSGKYVDNTIGGNGKKVLKIDEKLMWENQNVKTLSQSYIEYKYEGDKPKGFSNYNCFFEMNSKNKKIVQEIEDCENSANLTRKKLEEQNNQKDIDQL